MFRLFSTKLQPPGDHCHGPQRAAPVVGRVGGPGGGRLPASVLRAEAAARPAAGLFRGVPAARMRCGVVRDDQQHDSRNAVWRSGT